MDPRSRGKWRLRLGGRVVGALKEAGLVKIWASAAGSLLQLPSQLTMRRGSGMTLVSELSDFVAQPDRNTDRAVPSTFRPVGARVQRHTAHWIPVFFCPCKPATITSVMPLILLICSGEPRKVITWLFCPCSFVIVLKFGRDIKSNANRAQLDRLSLCAAWAAAKLAQEWPFSRGILGRQMLHCARVCARLRHCTALAVGLQEYPSSRPPGSRTRGQVPTRNPDY